MVTEWAWLLLLLACGDPGHAGHGEDPQDDVLSPWWGQLLGVRQIQPRTLRADKDDMFWATRGKRGIVIKPNGFFSLTKRSETAVPAMYYDYEYDDGYSPYWGMPHGLFGAYKRSQDTSEDEIDDDMLEYSEDNDESKDIDSEAADEIIDIEK